MYNWFLGNIAPENDCFSFLLGLFSGCKILVSGFPGYPNMATNSTFALNPSRLRRWGASFDSVEGRITLGKVWSLRDQTVNGHGEKQNRFNKESKAYPYSLPNTLDDNKEETCLKDQHSRWNVTPFLIDLSLVFQSYRTWGSIGVGLDPPKLTPPEEKAFRGSFHISKPKIAGLLIGKGLQWFEVSEKPGLKWGIPPDWEVVHSTENDSNAGKYTKHWVCGVINELPSLKLTYSF